jgi:pimeloyl-ACP methyl ester carboxylesterase
MTTAAPSAEVRHRHATVNGVRLHCAEAGEGPLVVLLHGFPEFWYSWRHQIAALARAGYRALAPDLRGYNESDKPAGVRAYRLANLVADVVGLIEQAGERRAAVVGHDWGGIIAWHVAMRRPDVVTRLAILNSPHPAAFRRELRNPAQWLRSWYILFFQLPWLPERLLSRGGYRFVREALTREPARPGAFPPEEVRLYREAIARPGALTAALNYYRALPRFWGEALRAERTVTAPTLVIWGERDRYLGVGMTRGLERWVPDVRVERLPGVSHWVQNDAPERVNELLVDFLSGRL